jgi:hypothetical protein
MKELVPVKSARVVEFLDGLNIGPRDKAKFKIEGGVISAHVKRANGRVQSASEMLGGRFRRLTDCKGGELCISERRKLVAQLDKERLPQTAIADLIGVSQATVSNDLRAIKAQKRERAHRA